MNSFTGFSKYHFIRMFTREKGISPYRYIEYIKMTEAKKLLKAGEALLDITYQLGFSSQSHFTNFFS
ncbi:helix-turn-helix transcriptional regulator [Cuneatibacter sp. NSJ-177]|uniref:helix-turn-helix transcriptional regulator n=1 Tax=Cuneatibacter sp. NSJ-177 TaxID=2931401 RepID=UPI002454E07A|nr:helix-turn-helix transcriptional regulator [Cuneatibacter sp. NSJ-177]